MELVAHGVGGTWSWWHMELVAEGGGGRWSWWQMARLAEGDLRKIERETLENDIRALETLLAQFTE